MQLDHPGAEIGDGPGLLAPGIVSTLKPEVPRLEVNFDGECVEILGELS